MTRREPSFGIHIRQNYSLVEQPVDILINKLTKISIIDVNVNGYLFGPAYLRY